MQTGCGGAQVISRLSLQQDLQKLSWITLSMDISLDVKRGGDTLIFSYIRRLWPFFGGFKILNFNILGFFRTMNIFGGMDILWLSFWGPYKIGLDLEVISMHFNVNVQNG